TTVADEKVPPVRDLVERRFVADRPNAVGSAYTGRCSRGYPLRVACWPRSTFGLLKRRVVGRTGNGTPLPPSAPHVTRMVSASLLSGPIVFALGIPRMSATRV